MALSISENKKSFIVSFLVILFGALILCYYAFYNMFPLVFSDTGTYINSGFKGVVPIDRPIVYGLFIRHTSLATSLWFVVFVQGIIISYLIYCLVKAFIRNQNHHFVFGLIICALTFTTCVSQKVSTLMPDIFAAAGCLCMILLIVKNELSTLNKVLIAILLLLSGLVHYSHGYISIITILLLIILNIFKVLNRQFIPIRNLFICLALIILSLILAPTISYVYGGGFKTSRSAHVFLTERLVQNGIMRSFLQENCATNKYKLCAYKDDIEHIDLMWGADSPIEKIGGWNNCKTELNQLLSDIFHSPKYLIMFVYKTIESSFKEFFSFQTDVRFENIPQGEGSAPDVLIKENFSHQRKEYLESFQNIGTLDYKDLNSRQNILIWLSFIMILWYAFKLKDIYIQQWSIILICVIYLYFNALICGGLSIPNPRYQSRVFWIIPLIFLIFTIENKFLQKATDYLLKRKE